MIKFLSFIEDQNNQMIKSKKVTKHFLNNKDSLNHHISKFQIKNNKTKKINCLANYKMLVMIFIIRFKSKVRLNQVNRIPAKKIQTNQIQMMILYYKINCVLTANNQDIYHLTVQIPERNLRNIL